MGLECLRALCGAVSCHKVVAHALLRPLSPPLLGTALCRHRPEQQNCSLRGAPHQHTTPGTNKLPWVSHHAISRNGDTRGACPASPVSRASELQVSGGQRGEPWTCSIKLQQKGAVPAAIDPKGQDTTQEQVPPAPRHQVSQRRISRSQPVSTTTPSHPAVPDI